MRARGIAARVALAGAVLGVIVGCGEGPASSGPTSVDGSDAVVTPPAGTPALPFDRPPDASLVAEGGEPVVGQLGTYLWGDGGSDSPWLPGAPMRVGGGEPLSVTLRPAAGLARWVVRAVPAAADGPAGAIRLATGSGPPRFVPPGAGSWTIELAVEFAGGRGSASYFWRLDVN